MSRRSNSKNGTRTCSGCGNTYPATREFYSPHNGVSDGCQSRCKKCQNEYGKTRYREREDVRIRSKRTAQRWYQENRSDFLAYLSEYRSRPEWPEQNLGYSRRRHRRIREATISTFTPEQRAWLIERAGSRCAYCGQITDKPETDHIIPVSRGGDHSFENIVIACHNCNRKKGRQTPEESGMYPRYRVNTLEHLEQQSLFDENEAHR